MYLQYFNDVQYCALPPVILLKWSGGSANWLHLFIKDFFFPFASSTLTSGKQSQCLQTTRVPGERRRGPAPECAERDQVCERKARTVRRDTTGTTAAHVRTRLSRQIISHWAADGQVTFALACTYTQSHIEEPHNSLFSFQLSDANINMTVENLQPMSWYLQ